MSNISTSLVELNQGLDLRTPKPMAAPGSLVECLNYEVVDFSGYKRIDGYERYDGQASPSITEYYRISTTDSVSNYALGDILVADKTVFYSNEVVAPVYFSWGGGDIWVDENGDYIVVNEGLSSSTSTGPFGVCLGTGSASGGVNYVYFAALNRKFFPGVGATVYRKDVTDDSNDDAVVATTIQVDHDFETSSAAVYANLLAYQEDLRGIITELPSTPIGLHWFRDRLYAVAGLTIVRLVCIETGGTDPETVDRGPAVLPQVGDVLTPAVTGGATLLVLAARDLGFDPSAEFENNNVVELDVLNLNGGPMMNQEYGGLWPPVGLTLYSGRVVSITADTQKAGLYVCKSIEQTLSEDTAPFYFGWKHVHLGWEVEFTNGDVPAGFIDKLERNNVSNNGDLIYFYDGLGTSYSAKVVSYYVKTGALTDGDAAGVLQITDLTLLTGTGGSIGTTFDIFSDSLLTVKIADVSATMEYNYLPGIRPLVENGSKYQFISSNFYGNDTFDAFYGVNGVGRAFYYDGTIFAKIYTQADDALDNPRHIANHLGHLALGFKIGSVQLSVVGEPWNYDGLFGASEIAVGDRVVGLSVLNGTMLGVFCEQSVWGISGSTVDNFNSQILVPNLGAIEYSIIDMGQPVFCTNWGISTLSQSEKYGDFVGGRVSQAVNPWLLNKLVDKNSQVYGSAGVLCAIPVRSKNQYRLFLKDGNILTMTLNSEGPPAFTIQKYDNGIVDGFVLPICYSSQVDQFGKERIHVGIWDEDAGGSPYAYELDTGWSFDGALIPANFETNWLYQGGPGMYATTAGVRIHGVVKGKASLGVTASSIETSHESNYTSASVGINLDRGLSRSVYQDYVPSTNIASLAKRGLGIQYKFYSTAQTNEPPHVVQVMAVNTRPYGQKDSH